MANPENDTKLRINDTATGEAQAYIGQIVVVDDRNPQFIEGCVYVRAWSGARFPLEISEWEVVDAP